MKTTLVAILVIASLFIVGCSNNIDTDKNIQGQTADTTGLTEDFVDQPAIDPDIGALDNIPVSEGLPQ